MGRRSCVGKYVRAEEKYAAEAQLEVSILKGLNSTEGELTTGDWAVLRKEALAKVKARAKRCRTPFASSFYNGH